MYRPTLVAITVCLSVACGLPVAAAELVFVANHGQWPDRVRYATEAATYRAAVTPSALEFHRRGGDRPVHLRFEGSRADATVAAIDERRQVWNFFRGRDRSRWRTHVPAFAAVLYRGLYEGIDVLVRGGGDDGTDLEYDLELAPRADIERVVVACEGADGVWIDRLGALVLETPSGAIRQPPPRTWQVRRDGRRVPIECRYRLLDDAHFGFEVIGRDPALELVIDPAVVWALALGTAGRGNFGGFGKTDAVFAMQRAPGGELVVAGQRSAFDFPEEAAEGDDCIELEGLDGGLSGFDAYVVRVDSNEGEILSVTLLGGASNDGIADLAFGPAGELAVVGYTESPEFPTTDGSVYSDGEDGFTALLDASGCNLLFSSLLGGPARDGLSSVAVGDDGALVCAGFTWSSTLPTKPGAMQPGFGGGGNDQIFLRYSPTEAGDLALDYLSYFGGNDWDARGEDDGGGNWFRDRMRDGDIALSEDGLLAVCGRTWSTDLPVTPNALKRKKAPNSSDGYFGLLRLDGALSPDEQIVYLSYLGGELSPAGPGSNGDAPKELALASDGSMWVTGVTWSNDFPTTPGAYRRVHAGGRHNIDVFLTKIGFDGDLNDGGLNARLDYSTFLGGSGDEIDATLTLLSDTDVVVGGDTWSADLPVNLGIFQGRSDGFVAVLDTSVAGSSALRFQGYFGGSGFDDVKAVVAEESRVWIALDAQSGASDLVDGVFGTTSIVAALDLRVEPRFLRGDCNDDGTVDLSDAVCILNWLFLGGATPSCVAVANTNGDAGEDISDAVYVLTHLFLGGPAPVAPFPECGPGTLPTDEGTCEIAPKNCPQ